MRRSALIILILLLKSPLFTFGFALLSHEAIIDKTWESSIEPLLKNKYPSSTDEQLKEARSYLYGGSLMPDIGYYPFGSVLFTHLVHYVRSGDFILAVLEEAQNLNEYAFGLGLLCHYNADKYGHSLGTNPSVALLFPKARKEFGDTITYEQAPIKHTRVEFGFDVLQTAKGNYAPKAQHDFIGFHVSEPVLERAFLKVYGINLKNIFKSLPLAIESFRFVVKNMFPELTKDSWKARKSLITKLNPLATQANYKQTIDKKSYNKEFGKPHLKSGLFSLVIGLLPKVGPLSRLKFKEPSEVVEKLFDKSFNTIVINYSESLEKLKTENIQIENINFDSGKLTRFGEYKMADKSYYTLLNNQSRNKFENTNKGLKDNLLEFYTTPKIAESYKNHPHRLKKITEALVELKKQKT